MADAWDGSNCGSRYSYDDAYSFYSSYSTDSCYSNTHIDQGSVQRDPRHEQAAGNSLEVEAGGNIFESPAGWTLDLFAGHTLMASRLTNALNAEDVPTASGRGQWSATSVQRVLVKAAEAGQPNNEMAG